MGTDLMLTEKDKIEQFKRDLRSYTYHQKKAMEIDEKLEELSVKMQGVSSPSTKEIILENAGNPYGERKLELLMEEGELVKERNKHLTEIQRIDEALRLIDAEGRNILIYVFVNHNSYYDSAETFSRSISKLRRDMNTYLKIILKNES